MARFEEVSCCQQSSAVHRVSGDISRDRVLCKMRSTVNDYHLKEIKIKLATFSQTKHSHRVSRDDSITLIINMLLN